MVDFQLPVVMPIVALAVFGLYTLLMVPLFRDRARVLAFFALLGIGLAGLFTWKLWGAWRGVGALETAHGMVRVDGFGLLVSGVLLGAGALTVFASVRFLQREDADFGEFYALLPLALAGMLTMVNTTHLMMVLIGLEVFSLALYVMTGMTRQRARSVEGALKYFLLGAFASGFFVYGLALLYGACGSLDMRAVADQAVRAPSPMLWLGMGLVLVAFAFKIAAVPFHHWVPDAYMGAPTNVTGFMAAATKTAAFAALLRFLPGAFGEQSSVWVPIITWLAILTMTVANLVALAQRNIKRLLAFSSISHAGYLLIALVCRPERAVSAVLYYLAAYAFMTIGAFAVAAAVGRGDARSEEGYELEDWGGLGWQRPALSVAMTVFMLSLAGIPPTAGFFGKYVIFQAAIEAERYLLAIVGVLNAVIGAYYYLRVLVYIWMREPEEEAVPAPWFGVTFSMAVVLVVAVVGTLYLGIVPEVLLRATRGLAAVLL